MNNTLKTVCLLVIFSLLPAALLAAKGPRIEFEKSSLDLGTVVRNSSANFAFRFKNTGDMPLRITEVRQSCDCVVLNSPPKEVAAGASAVISGQFNSGSYMGLVNQTIVVGSNDEKSASLLLTISVFVEQPMQVEPANPFFIFGQGMPEKATQLLTITSSDPGPYQITEIKSKVNFLTGKIVKTEKNITTIEITVDFTKIPEFAYYFLAVELGLTLQYKKGEKESHSTNTLITIFNGAPHN